MFSYTLLEKRRHSRLKCLNEGRRGYFIMIYQSISLRRDHSFFFHVPVVISSDTNLMISLIEI